MSGAGGLAGTRSERLLVVTGMSGAGRSTALKVLEDLGYEAVDNLPLSLLPSLLAAPTPAPLAIGVDVRTRDFGVSALLATLDRLIAQHALALQIVFLDCEDDRLVRRYTETRRRHPLAGDRPVTDGIALERQRVSPLRDRADLVIDTTALSPGELKRLLYGHFALNAQSRITIFVTSFSYRHGLPRDADLVFDVRFLPNPHFVPEFRPLTGRDPRVAKYIRSFPQTREFVRRISDLLVYLLPHYIREGKSYLTIGFGCTGGQHRSVMIAEDVGKGLHKAGYRVKVVHRDSPK